MSAYMTSDTADAIPISTVNKDSLPGWLDAHSDYGHWLSASNFVADPGSFALLPGRGTRLDGVLAAPSDGAAVWALANLPMSLPEGVYQLDHELDPRAATDAAVGWGLGAYNFAKYAKAKRASAVLVWPNNADVDEAARVTQSVFLARDLINTPAEDLGPNELVEAGVKVAKTGGADIRVVRGDGLLHENYPAIHAVGRASTRPPALLDFRWGEESAQKVTLVGKGVCFDTGGLDIKTHEGMLNMKRDMSGAAIVLGLAQALISANARIRLRVLVPAVDNVISGNAIRPLDIFRTRAGKTVEVSNTDAEGRLILCDALSDAVSEDPDLLVDVATLTGAAKIALGPELQALYCDDDEAAGGLQAAGAAVGDPLWRMPIWRSYRKQIDGKIADLNNFSASPLAGSIIGALYLAEFVSAAKIWVHLDIIGANLTTRPGRPEGGEATGLRALYSYIRGRYT